MAFVLHPNDVPPSLQLAPLGTRYMLALVEIADDETPVTGKEKVPSGSDPHKPALGADNASPARAPRKWDEITPAQQAGIRCNEPAFVKFLCEKYMGNIVSTEDAERYVRFYCGVESRRDIRAGAPLENWKALEASYSAWQLAPGVGAA